MPVHHISGRRTTPWIIVAVSGLVLLPQLGSAPLWDEDEPLNAACSLAMHAGGDWLVPTFNGRLRVEKPALINWVQLGGFALAGVNEGGARLGSALLTIGTCLLTWDIARRLFDPLVAGWAGVVMATFLWTGIAGRAATPDATLGFFTTLALAAFVRGMTGPQAPAGRIPWRAAAATGMAAGAAVLAKGPVGLCLPLTGFWLFALADRATGMPPQRTLPEGPSSPWAKSSAAGCGDWQPQKTSAFLGVAQVEKGHGWLFPRKASGETRGNCPWKERGLAFLKRSDTRQRQGFSGLLVAASSGGWLVPLSAVVARSAGACRDARLAVIGLAAVAIAAPWYAAVTLATGGEWLRGFLMVHNLGRFAAPMEGHSGSPLFYYPAVLLVGSFPWSSGWIPMARHAWKTARADGRESRGTRLLIAWIAAWVVPFCLAATKLPGYVWPAYPALACLTGLFLATWIRREDPVVDQWMRLAWVALGASGILLAAGLSLAAARFAPESGWLAWLGIIPVGGAVVAWVAHTRAGRGPAAATWALTAAATIGCLVSVVPAVAGRGGGVKNLIASASGRTTGSLVLYNAPPSAVFYAGRLTPFARVPEARTPESLAVLLAEDRAALVMVDARFTTEIEPVLPAGYRLLDSALVQPTGRRVLLLGPDAGSQAPVLAAGTARPAPPAGWEPASPR